MAASILDSREEIKKLDKENVLGSVEQLPDQIEHVWSEKDTVVVPESYKNISNIVVSGMGGSGLGAHVIKSLFKDELKYPLEIVNDYTLPSFVNEHTLVVLSSYSGTTEETLETAEEAKKRNAKIAVIAAGGRLLEFAKENSYPIFEINPTFNPSNQPRMAIGYSVFGQLALFAKCGIISIQDADVKKVVLLLRQNAQGLLPESIEQNTAKYLAFSAVDKAVALVSAEHLEGAVHVFNNQLNENAKNFTTRMQIPELNHHVLESLAFPKQLKDDLVIFFVQSTLYHPRTRLRFPLTLDVAKQNGMFGETILAVSETKLEQVWEIIQLGAYTNFYLAMLNGINPAPIPWVDYFKEQLANAE